MKERSPLFPLEPRGCQAVFSGQKSHDHAGGGRIWTYTVRRPRRGRWRADIVISGKGAMCVR